MKNIILLLLISLLFTSFASAWDANRSISGNNVTIIVNPDAVGDDLTIQETVSGATIVASSYPSFCGLSPSNTTLTCDSDSSDRRVINYSTTGVGTVLGVISQAYPPFGIKNITGATQIGSLPAPIVSIISPVNGQTYNNTSLSLLAGANQEITTWIYNLNEVGNVTFSSGIATITAQEGDNVLRVYGINANGVGLRSILFRVNTTVSDTTSPEIINVQAETSQTFANITWNTNENSTSTVYYGLSNLLGSFVSSITRVLAHTISLDSLVPNSLYYYLVSSCDASGNCANSSIYNFTTLQTWEEDDLTVNYVRGRIVVNGENASEGQQYSVLVLTGANAGYSFSGEVDENVPGQYQGRGYFDTLDDVRFSTGATFRVTVQGYSCFAEGTFANGGNGDFEDEESLVVLECNTPNDAPTLDSVGNKVVNEGQPLEFNVSASDLNGDPLIFMATGVPVGAIFTDLGDFATFSWTPSFSDSGEYFVEFIASDNKENDSEVVLITVNNVNRAPILEDIEDQQILQTSVGSVLLNASDPDGDVLNYSVVEQNIDQVICEINGNNLSMTPALDWFGNTSCNISVSDGNGGIASKIVNIEVLFVNSAPILIKQFENITWNEGVNLTDYLNLSEYFYDAHSTLSYSVQGNHFVNVIINQTTSLVSFYSIGDFFGSENIVFNASDGEFSVYGNAFTLNVLAINQPPQFTPLSCQTTIAEDIDYDCVVNATDRENNSFSFSVGQQNNLSCSFEGNLLNYSSFQDYFGPASCELIVSDGYSSQNLLFNVNVTPVNDEPIQIKQFENITWNENTDLVNYLDLSEYFVDVDSNLSYSVLGNQNVNVIINQTTSLVSFYPDEDFFGSEVIFFNASEGVVSIKGNNLTLIVVQANKAPQFVPLACQTTIAEDVEYDCVVNATDRENDSLWFSAGQQNNLSCSFEGNVLSYVSSLDHNGPASCELIVSDSHGSRSLLFNVNVTPVNDAPRIVSKNPSQDVVIKINQQQSFSAGAIDPESDALSQRWYLNGTQVATNSYSYLFNSSLRGNYYLEFFVSDFEYNASTFWNIFVGEEIDFTCSQNNGHICSANQYCPTTGRLFNSSDSDSCCSVACANFPPTFSAIRDKHKCTNASSEISISFEEPEEDEEYLIGEDKEIKVELEIENDFEEDMDFDVVVYLYDLTRDKVVASDSDDLDVDERDDESIEFVFNIENENLDDERDYALFAYIADGSYCSQAYQTIVIDREEDFVVFRELELSSSSVGSSEYLNVIASLENLGKNDEDVVIKVVNTELGVNFQTEEFPLDEGDEDSFNFDVLLPSRIELKEYEFTFSLDYDGDTEVMKKTILLGQNEQIEVTEQTILLNSKKEPSSRVSYFNFSSWFFPAMVILFGIVIFLSILYVIKILFFH